MSVKFFPITRAEMDSLGWETVDFVFVSGDAYVDHPSFAAAILCRTLEDAGYKVAILPQPDFKTTKDFSYQIIRRQKEKEEIISSSTSDNVLTFEDSTAISNEVYEYFIIFKNQTSGEIFESNHITLKSF